VVHAPKLRQEIISRAFVSILVNGRFSRATRNERWGCTEQGPERTITGSAQLEAAAAQDFVQQWESRASGFVSDNLLF
jgi:hypothetical protein